MILELVGGEYTTETTASIVEGLNPDAPQEFRELAAVLVQYCEQREHRLIGLSGGQGSGKSTLGALLQEGFKLRGERAYVLSIDDFYLTRRERQELAAAHHELFETRGPPGTHDIAWLSRAVDALRNQQEVEVPVFDKGIDDRSGNVVLKPPCDRVIVEGWCVGARAQLDTELLSPINDLERLQDPDAHWRRRINDKLQTDYAEVWARFDCLVYLKVPNLESVRRWRLQQEQHRRVELRKDEKWVENFVQHYQRITEWMLNEMPSRANVVVRLDDEHKVAGIDFR